MLTYSLSGTDANASFGIVESSTGQLKTKGPLNYEGPQNVYDVIVTVSDGALTDSVEVSIAVNDVRGGAGNPGCADGRGCSDRRANVAGRDLDGAIEHRAQQSRTTTCSTALPIASDDFTDASHDGVGV